MIARPPVRATAVALTVGTVVSAALFVAALAFAAVRLDEPARLAGNGGVISLLLSPAVGLAVTALELRGLQPRAAALAVVVLGILGFAVAVALVSR